MCKMRFGDIGSRLIFDSVDSNGKVHYTEYIGGGTEIRRHVVQLGSALTALSVNVVNSAINNPHFRDRVGRFGVICELKEALAGRLRAEIDGKLVTVPIAGLDCPGAVWIDPRFGIALPLPGVTYLSDTAFPFSKSKFVVALPNRHAREALLCKTMLLHKQAVVLQRIGGIADTTKSVYPWEAERVAKSLIANPDSYDGNTPKHLAGMLWFLSNEAWVRKQTSLVTKDKYVFSQLIYTGD